MNFDSEALISLATDYGARVVGAILVLFIGLQVAGWLSGLVGRMMDKRGVDPTLTSFFSGLVRYVVIALVVITSLSSFGVETTSFAAVIGASGLAIGLALQGMLGHLAAGVMLIFFRPFKIGDYVLTAGTAGTVKEISLFTTPLQTPDARVIIVPNGSVFGSVIENVTFNNVRRMDVNVGVAYSADLDATRAALQKAIEDIENRESEPESQVYLLGLGASSVDWVVRVWIKGSEFWPSKEKLTMQVKRRLDEAGLEIPFPQMDVHVDGELVQKKS